MPDNDKQIDDDFEYSRKTYYDLIEKGQDALEEMIQVARALEHPRAFEVVATMMKNISDVNDRLMDLHKKKANMQPATADSNNTKSITNNNTAVFIGSTTDLQKLMLDMNNDVIENVEEIKNEK
jgi:hypothetical protein